MKITLVRAPASAGRRAWIGASVALGASANPWMRALAAAPAEDQHAHPNQHQHQQPHQHDSAAASPLAAWAHSEPQAALGLARRVFAAFERLGEPLPPARMAAIDAAESGGDLRTAAAAALLLLDTRVLLTAAISPEARVSVRRRLTSATLVQAGWRLFLARMDNPARVPGKLAAHSPNAVPVHGAYAPDTPGGLNMGTVGRPTTRGDVAQRWMDLDVHDEAPLDAQLEDLPFDFKILRIYARDAARRSAMIQLDIGAGTADIGARDGAALTFNVLPAKAVWLDIRDADGAPVTCSLLIRDALGRAYPSQTRRSAPDMFFQKRIYRADGETVTLPPGRYQLEAGRGPEYLMQRAEWLVPEQGAPRWDIRLVRWIDPAARHWYSGDHHIHAAGCSHYQHPEEGISPEMLVPQVRGEALAIGSVLTWGPGFHTQKRHFSGRDHALSTPSSILHYDLEVSGFPSAHCGHLGLLQMRSMDYPGTTRPDQWPSSNAPVLRWARSQGALTGYTHAGLGLWANTTALPNDAMPPFNSIGANDYIVTLPEGLVDFIGTCNQPAASELNIWYHTLNVGLWSTIAGETDWPCIFDESIGMGRSYVKVDGPLSYAAWCAGIKAGRAYVSEGRAHLMDFSASAGGAQHDVGGGDLHLAGPAAVTLRADVAARLEPEPSAATEAIRSLAPLDKPYWHIERCRLGATRQVMVELVVNGLPVETRSMAADGDIRTLSFEYAVTRSCWIALRILGAAHTNPIRVIVDGKPIRSKGSAAWCRAAVDQCWREKMPRIRPAERAAEAELYERARRFYERMIAEAAA
jgi:hypothetical protein